MTIKMVQYIYYKTQAREFQECGAKTANLNSYVPIHKTVQENVVMEKYDIEIAGIAMTVKTDENEDFVRYVVDELDRRINEMTMKNIRCSKTEAALLSALDYCCDKIRLEKKVKNLEAQVALYTANVNRLKSENTELKERLGEDAKH